MQAKSVVLFTAIAIHGAFVQSGAAQDAGLKDLDEAVIVKLFAGNRQDLERTVDLCDQAITKGLSEEHDAFARKLAASTLYEYAEMLSRNVLDRDRPPQGWQVLRTEAVRRLEKAVTYDKKFNHAFYLLARLLALPGGDRVKAIGAAGQAIRHTTNDNQTLAKALLLRGNLQTEDQLRLADYNQAIVADPANADALRTRGVYYLSKGEVEKATEDLRKLLEHDNDSVIAHHALAEALIGEERYDEALKHLDEAVRVDPKSPNTHTLRARIHVMQSEVKKALADLDEALKIDRNNVAALLMRCRVHLSLDDAKAARADVERALVVQPGLIQGVLLRSLISAAESNYSAAIRDMERLVASDPANTMYRMQLASYFVGDERPRRAISVFTSVLRDNRDNVPALRGRADALLSIGKHADAIADYEVALKADPKNGGVLNNLAWVLATSPDDKIRDGQRSIELALKACEVTQYKQAHVISTLAASYAESGDFATAKKWSSKAVAMGEGEVKKQLQQELDSYEKEKPWRELQQTKEKPEPTRGGGDFEL